MNIVVLFGMFTLLVQFVTVHRLGSYIQKSMDKRSEYYYSLGFVVYSVNRSVFFLFVLFLFAGLLAGLGMLLASN
jgi:hypothetical protein